IDAKKLLDGSRGFAFGPKATRARMVDSSTPRYGLPQTLVVRVSKPQGLAVLANDDRREKSVGSIGTKGRCNGVCEIDPARVKRHPNLSVGSQSIDRCNLLQGRYASCHRESFLSG